MDLLLWLWYNYFIMFEKILICVTGKSGVGKSIFSKKLAENLDALLVGFDSISHLSLKDENIKFKIKEYFGSGVFIGENIDRKKLGTIVFLNEEKMQFLNNLSQEFMEKYIDNLIAHSNKHFIVLEYALMTKMKYFSMSNYRILITADKKSRFDRLKIRDNVSNEYLDMREKNLPNYDKFNFDEIIENSGNNEEKLYLFADKIAEKIKIQTSKNSLV